MNWLDTERLIHSVKTVAACLLGLIAARLIGFQADQWIIITIIVVMCAQIYVGSVLNKAYLRFLGTLIGCLFAMLAIALFGDSKTVVICTILLSSFVFSYVAAGQGDLSYAGTLGAVTTAIIMLGQTPTLMFAIERFLEISVGILIATLVSQFVAPIHARTHLQHEQALTLKELADFYQSIIIDHQESHKNIHQAIDLDEEIVKSLLKQRMLAKESKRELIGKSFSNKYFLTSLYREKEILRAIAFMHRALDEMKDAGLKIDTTPTLQHFNLQVITFINLLIAHLQNNHQQRDPLPSLSLSELKQEWQNTYPATLTSVNGFLSAADELTRSLTKLARQYDAS